MHGSFEVCCCWWRWWSRGECTLESLDWSHPAAILAISGYTHPISFPKAIQGHPRCHVVSHGVTSQDGSKTSKRSASQEFIPVATTRPETILGDSAVCVHPEVGSGWNWMEMVGIMSPQCGKFQAPNISQPHLFQFFQLGNTDFVHWLCTLNTWGLGAFVFLCTLTKKKLETVWLQSSDRKYVLTYSARYS